MDASTLLKVINGQRKLGEQAQAVLLKKLGYENLKEQDLFSIIADEDFDQMPEWYDTAILEQITVTGFKATKKSLSKVFKLSETQIEAALARLLKLKLIKVLKTGVVKDATSGMTTNIPTVVTSRTKRDLQKQFLQKAIASIDNESLEERDMTTITCAIDDAKIPAAKELIKQFRRELAEFLASGGKSTRTYNVTIALYPLTKNFKEFV